MTAHPHTIASGTTTGTEQGIDASDAALRWACRHLRTAFSVEGWYGRGSTRIVLRLRTDEGEIEVSAEEVAAA